MSKNASAKPTTAATTAPNQDGMPDFSNFVEEQVGFPPYWNPSEGARFYGRVTALDSRDPEFMRWVVQHMGAPIECATGAGDDAEPVMVKKGEFFTLSVYAALPFQNYMNLDVLVGVKGKRDLKGSKTLWVFTLQVSPETKKILESRQAEAAARLNAPKSPQLEGPGTSAQAS